MESQLHGVKISELLATGNQQKVVWLCDNDTSGVVRFGSYRCSASTNLLVLRNCVWCSLLAMPKNRFWEKSIIELVNKAEHGRIFNMQNLLDDLYAICQAFLRPERYPTEGKSRETNTRFAMPVDYVQVMIGKCPSSPKNKRRSRVHGSEWSQASQ